MAVAALDRFVLAVQHKSGLRVVKIFLAIRPMHHSEFPPGVVAVAGKASRAIDGKHLVVQTAFRLYPRFDFEMAIQALLCARSTAQLVAFDALRDAFQKRMRHSKVARRNLRIGLC